MMEQKAGKEAPAPQGTRRKRERALTRLELQSRFGDTPLKFQVICPQNETAVLKGLKVIITGDPS